MFHLGSILDSWCLANIAYLQRWGTHYQSVFSLALSTSVLLISEPRPWSSGSLLPTLPAFPTGASKDTHLLVVCPCLQRGLLSCCHPLSTLNSILRAQGEVYSFLSFISSKILIECLFCYVPGTVPGTEDTLQTNKHKYRTKQRLELSLT